MKTISQRVEEMKDLGILDLIKNHPRAELLLCHISDNVIPRLAVHMSRNLPDNTLYIVYVALYVIEKHFGCNSPDPKIAIDECASYTYLLELFKKEKAGYDFPKLIQSITY